ncbi:NAD+ synthase [Leptolyngbya sp. FACHB-261]|uniref:NAD+ synthase n=1 Tax=Leptolyngbya sp. FACHB-261 TaxID=2692806 RepID=UPI0016878ACC|nr:NAD+ synthase [Leptolyngbya sp. FACHB-261]MBD2102854.1 NAD+ synthase [Leptolyngbya sp. FACHB-261]
MKLAIAQLNPTIGDLAGNARQILRAAQAAAAQGATLLLTPELSLCGYPPRDLLLDPSFVADCQATLEQLVAEFPAALTGLIGTIEFNPAAEQAGGKPLFNSTALVERGKIRQLFHKRLLPTYDVFDEDRYFEPGHQPNIFTLDGIKIGVTICEDLWNDDQFWGKRLYPHNPIEDLAKHGVDVVVNLSASPYSVAKQKLRESMLHYTAVRFQLPVIYVNQIGANDDLIFDGHSVAFNRQGEVVARAQGFTVDLLNLELDPVKRDLPLGALHPLPECEDAEIWQALVLGLRDYTHKCGFKNVVVGLSGGIDSALTAAIAAEALGPEQVIGVLMPSPYSSDHSVKDALDLAKNLGIVTHTLPIAPLMQGFETALSGVFAGTKPGIAEENIQSRIRGNLLMALSNKFGYLLLTTGNKSELAVGYCTLYGDMCGGLAVISDVPKTRVYSLCRWRNQQSLVIPEHVLTKAPSAELKPDQVDQDSLPAYEILDDILQRLIDAHEAPAQIVAAGHNPDTVAQVAQLVARAEFKRRQSPPGLKITDRAFGSGWRMPIAARRTTSPAPSHQA